MKKIIYYSALIAFLVSCSQNTDKKVELEKLKTQHDQLATQIAQLEAEINPEGAKAEQKAITVKVTPSVQCVFNHYIQVQGTVDGDQNIAVSPQMAGIVTAVYVTEGSPVKKGQVMVELDAQVMKQSLEEVNTQLALVTSIYEKQSALWDKKIGSEIQYLQAKKQQGIARKTCEYDEGTAKIGKNYFANQRYCRKRSVTCWADGFAWNTNIYHSCDQHECGQNFG